MSEDFKLSPHFSFFELTKTGNVELQERNRHEAMAYLPTLKALADMLEFIRGDRPLVVNSAFRCWALNGATPGSSSTSQHPKGQAADCVRPGEDVSVTVAETLAKFKATNGERDFGQLIDESANRSYGVVRWMHISLGRKYWTPARCGEVMKKYDVDGKAKFELVEKVVFPTEDI